ncbi:MULTISPECIES: porin [unclassified Caballeronia]|uniref:porin n=1 Tax=unclassified Caballeronia TaxID=2646786 RepID=UPI0013EDF7AA|nr:MULTISPECIES: porin [unclassified Caballeronia]
MPRNQPNGDGRHVPQFFGLSGQEDLGGGESAFFRYTQTIATANGVASAKEGYVGLADATFGRVSLGRQCDLIADLLPYFSEYYMSVSGVHPGDFDRSAGTYLNNPRRQNSCRVI